VGVTISYLWHYNTIPQSFRRHTIFHHCVPKRHVRVLGMEHVVSYPFLAECISFHFMSSVVNRGKESDPTSLSWNANLRVIAHRKFRMPVANPSQLNVWMHSRSVLEYVPRYSVS